RDQGRDLYGRSDRIDDGPAVPTKGVLDDDLGEPRRHLGGGVPPGIDRGAGEEVADGVRRHAGAIVLAMGQSLPMPPPGFDALPVWAQIDYVQTMWGRIGATVDKVPLQEWQQAVLAERLAAQRQSPGEARPWREAIERVQQRLRSGR